MTVRELRVGVAGRIGDHTASTLGGRIEATADGFEFVAPYVDQAQVTGLLLRLADLHIEFHRVAVTPSDDPNTSDDDSNNTSNDNHNQNTDSNDNEGAQP